jgi:hypothetical protein
LQIIVAACAHTDVVLTPHSSNFSKVGVGALGVSMNSNSLSEPLVLWGLEDMTAIFPIDDSGTQQRKMLKKCVACFMIPGGGQWPFSLKLEALYP